MELPTSSLLNYHIEGNFIKADFHPIRLFLYAMAGLVFILPTIKRDLEIRSVLRNSGHATNKLTNLSIFTIFFGIVPITGLTSTINTIPAYTSALFFALQNGYFTDQLTQNQSCSSP